MSRWTCARAIALLLTSAIAATGCGSGGASPPTDAGRLRVLLHDAPDASVDEVWVRFDEVAASHEQKGWIVVSSAAMQVDLLKLQGGVVAELGLGTLPPGRYGQVRLHLVDAWVVVSGVKQSLKVPSGAESGIKIAHGFVMPECGTLTMTLDWDVGAHLIANEGQGYVLRPVVTVDGVTADVPCPCDFTARRIADLPVSLRIVGASEAFDGRIYVLGGSSAPNAGDYPYQQNVYEYDIDANSYRDLGPILPYGMNLKSFNIARADNGKLYVSPVIGTMQNNGWGGHSRVVEVDTAAGTAVEKASFGGTIWDMAVANGGDGHLYFFGGWNGGPINNIWQYDPATDALKVVAPLPVVGNSPDTIARASDGKIYVFNNGYASSIVVFNPADFSTQTIPQPGGVPYTVAWESPKGTLWTWKDEATLLSLDTASSAVKLVPLGGPRFASLPHAFSVDYARHAIFGFGGQSPTADRLADAYRIDCLHP